MSVLITVTPSVMHNDSNVMPVWCQYDANMMPVWCQKDASMMPVWWQYDTSMTPVWRQYDASMTPVWCQYDANMMPVWCQNDANASLLLEQCCIYVMKVLCGCDASVMLFKDCKSLIYRILFRKWFKFEWSFNLIWFPQILTYLLTFHLAESLSSSSQKKFWLKIFFKKRGERVIPKGTTLCKRMSVLKKYALSLNKNDI